MRVSYIMDYIIRIHIHIYIYILDKFQWSRIYVFIATNDNMNYCYILVDRSYNNLYNIYKQTCD